VTELDFLAGLIGAVMPLAACVSMYRGERRASLMQKYGEEDVIKL
jgi:hypothetical protein